MPAIALDNTLGAGFIGCIFTSILYGVTCVQCYIYSQHCKRDSRLIKNMVWILWMLDSLHLAFVVHSLYWYMITNFTDITVVGKIPWTITAGICVTPTSDTVVRTFFTYRVWILSNRNRWLTFPLGILVYIIWGIGIGFGIKGFFLTTFVKFAELAWLLYLGLGLLVVGDIYIASSLCYFLYQGRSSADRRTDSLINVLMLYTINTGLVTSIFSLACFITYAAMPRNYIFLAMYFPLSKLYLNALLATLNARDSLKNSNNVLSIPTSRHTGTTTIPVAFASPTQMTEMSINIEREEFKNVD